MDDVQAGKLMVQWDAKIDKFIEKANQVLTHNKHVAHQVEEDWKKIDLQGAMGKVFDRGRLSIMESGAEHIGVMGVGLEHLGVAGLAAGAALGAFGAGLEVAEKTGEWATELGHLSEKLGLTTELVQRFDYVWAESGVGVDKGREAVTKLNEVFGKAQAGLLKPVAMKAFEALGFDRKSLQEMGDVSNLLEALPERFEHAGSASVKAAIAEKLGIESLVPIMHAGAGGMADLVLRTQDLAVMSDQAVGHAARLNNELNTAKMRVHNAAMSFGEDMQPALVSLNDVLATTIIGFEKLFDLVAKGPPVMQQVAEQLDIAAKARAAAANARAGGPLGLGGHTPGGSREVYARDQDRRADEAMAKANALNSSVVDAAAEERKRGAEERKEAEEAAKRRAREEAAALAAAMRKARGRGPTGPSPEAVAKTGDDAVARATEGELRAREAMTQNIQARLAISLQLLDAETKQKTDDLEHEVAEKKITRAKADEAKTLIRTAADEEAARLKRASGYELEDRAADVHRTLVNASISQMSDEAEMAGTSAQRRVIEAKILKARQDLETELENARLDRAVADGSMSPKDADAEKAALAAAHALEQKKAAYNSTYSGVRGALDAAVRGGWPGLAKYMGDKLKENLLDALANGLTNVLIGGGKGGGGLFGAVLSAALGIPHLATGTESASGGPTVVGENGREIVNLPRGARVTPNHALSNLQIGQGSSRPIFAPFFNLEGAVVTQDLVDQMNAIGRNAATQGAAMGLAAARALVPVEMSRRASLQIR